jgi:hypothetical protein
MLNKISFPLNYSSNTNTPTYRGLHSTTTIINGGSNTSYTNQIKTKTKTKITIPGTDILVNDDWQNNMCAWFIKKYGVEGMLEFIEENPIYLEFLDRSFSDYLKDMKKIVDRNKKIEQLIG